jgi:hypothetical protein
VSEEDAHFVRLEITPAEVVFKKPSQTAQLRVVAHWSDGTAEDVTPLCRYRTNDESIAEIDENGLVKSLGKGDTHVVAFYDNGVAPTQVMLPVSDKIGKKYPSVPTPRKIDELVIAKLRKLGIVPSELADDAEFLRRVSLDISGTLPAPDEIVAFVEDSSPDKRAKKIDELLERPAYAAWWATLFCDMTGNNPRAFNQLQPINGQIPSQWYAWIHRRIKQNTPYHEIVAGIVLASSRLPDQGYDEFLQDMAAYYGPADHESHKDFAERATMPYYWARQTVRTPDDMALNFSHTFLGVRLQCAQCHKHPFDQWTQSDFQQFAAFFGRMRFDERHPDAAKRYAELMESTGLRDVRDNQKRRQLIGELVAKGQVVPWREVYVQPVTNPGRDRPNRGNQNRNRPQNLRTPKVLGGEEVTEQLPDPRQALMDWMLEKDNPYFARAVVNRIWAHYFGVGIIDPPDDLNLANPPSNAALLDHLADAFIEHGFDLKWLHREITNSRTYQLTWQPNETNQYDTRNFAHATVRRLPAEVAYDAILLATASAEQIAKLQADPTGRAISDPRSNPRGGGRGNQQQYALRVFGQPERATACDCERSTEPSLTQSLYLMNDQELFTLMDRRDGRFAELSREIAAASRPPERDKPGAKDRPNARGLRNRAEMAQRVKEAERRVRQLKDEGKTEEAANLERKLNAFREELKRAEREAKPDGDSAEKPAAAETAERAVEPAKPAIDADQLVREMYLRTLSRFPTEQELSRTREYLGSAKDPLSGVRDVLWALLNTKEFIVNH